MKYGFILILMSFISSDVFAIAPKINFTDLISGPSTGLGDKKGEGVIVTIWGQSLGSIPDESKVFFTDSLSVKREVSHLYYWKNADGNLPGGPAKLFESHRMQEISVSIPSSADGPGFLSVEVNGELSNNLPFLVRNGKIVHVINRVVVDADGSFDKPFSTIAIADAGSNTGAGDIIYIHDVNTVQGDLDKGAIYNNVGFSANESNQMAYVSYPGFQPYIEGRLGFRPYLSTGIVISKLMVFASNCGPNGFDPNDDNPYCESPKGTYGISTTDFGRVIGNSVTDRAGGCADGQAGAISGGHDYVDNAKILGNYVYEYGCPETNKLHHTTYMTIRDVNRPVGVDPVVIKAWEWGWNHLKDNFAKNGIHNYDEDNSGNNECGNMITDLLIHDNVIRNQAGSGVTIMSRCGWSQDTYIYNNLLVNVGLPSDINCSFNCGANGSAINIEDNGLLGDVYLLNNSILNWDKENLPNAGTSSACFSVSQFADNVDIIAKNNICFNNKEKHFVGNFVNAEQLLDNFTGGSNIWYHPSINQRDVGSEFGPPSWDSSPFILDPLYVELPSAGYAVSKDSPALNASSPTNLTITHDLYGVPRSLALEIGAIEFFNRPLAPSNLLIE
jgi:hypothetical protein